MNKIRLMYIFSISLFIFSLTSCTTYKNSLREPNSRVEFNKGDFEFSNQVSAEASSTKILMIDWSKLFLSKQGNVDKDMSANINLVNIPVIGNILVDQTSSYALYNLMEQNKGYDVIFYPQYEVKTERPIGLGFIYKKTNVKVKAKLGKIKN